MHTPKSARELSCMLLGALMVQQQIRPFGAKRNTELTHAPPVHLLWCLFCTKCVPAVQRQSFRLSAAPQTCSHGSIERLMPIACVFLHLLIFKQFPNFGKRMVLEHTKKNMSGELQPSAHDSGSQAKSHGHNSRCRSLSSEPKKNKSEAACGVNLPGSSRNLSGRRSFHFPIEACLCVWEMVIEDGFKHFQEVIENGMIDPTTVQQCVCCTHSLCPCISGMTHCLMCSLKTGCTAATGGSTMLSGIAFGAAFSSVLLSTLSTTLPTKGTDLSEMCLQKDSFGCQRWKLQ